MVTHFHPACGLCRCCMCLKGLPFSLSPVSKHLAYSCSSRQVKHGPACWCAWLLKEVRPISCRNTLPGASLQGCLKELLRGQVFWYYQEGLIIPRESIQTGFNGMGSQTAVSPHDKENLKYPVFIMLSVFNYACL